MGSTGGIEVHPVAESKESVARQGTKAADSGLARELQSALALTAQKCPLFVVWTNLYSFAEHVSNMPIEKEQFALEIGSTDSLKQYLIPEGESDAQE